MSLRRAGPALRWTVALLVAAPWVAMAVVRTFGLEGGHLLASAVAFVPYAALTSPAPVVVAAALRRRPVALVALVAALLLVVAVLPRAFSGQAEEAAGRGAALTVATVNLLHGQADADAVVRLARRHDVDVLSLQEVNDALPRLDAAGARRLFGHRVVATFADGSALFADRPLQPLGRPGTAALRLPGGRRLRLRVVHPSPPLSDEAYEEWTATLRSIPSAGGRDLHVVAGDFNATLDHSAFRDLLERGYVDAADAAGQGLETTWPTNRRRPEIAIDHVLVDRRIAVRNVSVHEVPGTDHRAVIAELRVPLP